MYIKVPLFLCFWLLASCVTVQSVSVNPIPQKNKRKKLVTSYDSNPVVLMIPFGTSYVEEASAKLAAKCPGGKIEGVISKHQSKNYWLFSIWSVTMQGYCTNPRS